MWKFSVKSVVRMQHLCHLIRPLTRVKPFYPVFSLSATSFAQDKKLRKVNNQKISVAVRSLNNGDINKSAILLNEVLESNPEEVVALCHRAYIHFHLGKHQEAYMDSQKAISINMEQTLLMDHSFSLHVNLLLRYAKFEDLLQYGNTVAQITKKYNGNEMKNICTRVMTIAALNNLLFKGEYENGIKFFEQKVQPALNNFDETVHLWYIMAQLLLKVGRFEEALNIANTYLTPEVAGDSVSLFYHIYTLANSYLGHNDVIKDAIKNWEELLEDYSSPHLGQDGSFNEIIFAQTKAKIFSSAGNRSAIGLFNDALTMAKNEDFISLIPEILTDMAIAENSMGMKREATMHMKEALQYVPNHILWSKMNFN
jgi:tetratricopeptide (TPR) repeat protein